MSRKTAVCVLFAVLLFAGTAIPAQAISWTADGPPQAIAAETSPSMDPDGLTPPDPGIGSAFLKYLVSFLLGSLVA